MLRTIDRYGELWLARDTYVDRDDAEIPFFTMHPIPSKTGDKFEAMLPDTVVLHYTAGDSLVGALDHWEDIPASAHFVVDRDGSVTQVVPFNRVAWHCGRSQWRAWTGEMRFDLNAYAIGIELVNPGKLSTLGTAHATAWNEGTVEVDRWQTWYGKDWPEYKAVQVGGGWWATYPEAQVNATIALLEILQRELQWSLDIELKEIIGHSDIAPGRKQDPGQAWPMARAKAVLERHTAICGDKATPGRLVPPGATKVAVPASPGLLAASTKLRKSLGWMKRLCRWRRGRSEARTKPNDSQGSTNTPTT